jgi:hypothetical protein
MGMGFVALDGSLEGDEKNDAGEKEEHHPVGRLRLQRFRQDVQRRRATERELARASSSWRSAAVTSVD